MPLSLGSMARDGSSLQGLNLHNDYTMDNCERDENLILDMLTEQVLEAHDGPLGRAETAFFNVAGVNIENEVIETAWMVYIQRQAGMWQELARLAYAAGTIHGQSGVMLPDAVIAKSALA